MPTNPPFSLVKGLLTGFKGVEQFELVSFENEISMLQM